MCGRYDFNSQVSSERSRIRWNLDKDLPLFKPRYNIAIAPQQEAPVIVQADGVRSAELCQWGLVPAWAKDPAMGNQMINARPEMLAVKRRWIARWT